MKIKNKMKILPVFMAIIVITTIIVPVMAQEWSSYAYSAEQSGGGWTNKSYVESDDNNWAYAGGTGEMTCYDFSAIGIEDPVLVTEAYVKIEAKKINENAAILHIELYLDEKLVGYDTRTLTTCGNIWEIYFDGFSEDVDPSVSTDIKVVVWQSWSESNQCRVDYLQVKIYYS